MSLDVYLKQKGANVAHSSSGIFIRENGEMKEITEQEWNARFPDREPVRLQSQEIESDQVYWANITHNLTAMASAAEVYYPLWRPDEIGITKASQLILPLAKGLDALRAKPEYYKSFNPENGWGTYEGLVDFVNSYLRACIEYPDAIVEISR